MAPTRITRSGERQRQQQRVKAPVSLVDFHLARSRLPVCKGAAAAAAAAIALPFTAPLGPLPAPLVQEKQSRFVLTLCYVGIPLAICAFLLGCCGMAVLLGKRWLQQAALCCWIGMRGACAGSSTWQG